MPKATPEWRFDWQVKPFALEDSPERYRALYAFSASNLNLSTSLWTVAQFLTEPNELNRKRAAQVDMDRLTSITPHQKRSPHQNRSGMDALRQSMLGARELIFLCGAAKDVGHPFLKSRSKRFPRFILTKRDGSALSQDAFRTFITGEVEQSAMSLIANALQLRDQALARASTDDGTKDSPDDVREQIAAGVEPDRHAIVNWLVSNTHDYKVCFNLACYFSRDNFGPAGDEDSTLTNALEQLKQAVALSLPQVKRSLVAAAGTDPALAAVRIQRPLEFKEAIGAAVKEDQSGDHSNNGDVRSYKVVLADFLSKIVPGEAQRARLEDMLTSMLPKSEPKRIERQELLQESNWSVQRVEYNMATEPAANHIDDDADRMMLARILFLPKWTGTPTDATGTNGGATKDPSTPETPPEI